MKMKSLTLLALIVGTASSLAGPVSWLFKLPETNDWTKSRSNTQNAGPRKLWAIEQLIDVLVAKAKWDTILKVNGAK